MRGPANQLVAMGVAGPSSLKHEADPVPATEAETMDMSNPASWKGVYPATVLPLGADLEIDESDLRWLMPVEGICGLTCNDHAGGAWSLSPTEQRRVTEIHVAEAGGPLPVLSGISGSATADYIEAMRDARDAGADAVLVIPPASFRGIAARGPDVPYAFFQTLPRRSTCRW